MGSDTHRIVLVSGGIRLGGATTFLLNLGQELVRRGVAVLVVSLEHDNPHASDFELLGIPLHVEDERKSIFEDRLVSALRVVRSFDPTAVISCLGPASYEILRYVPKSVTRLGMIQSDFPENYPPFAPYIESLDGIVGVSRQIEANLRAHPILKRVPAFYLPYGVPMPQNGIPRRREHSEVINILYLGRLCRPQKRVHLFPRILHGLKEAGLSFQWTIGGDGPERAWLEKELLPAPANALIKFTGPVPYRDVPQLLASHDVFLLPSDAEGLPLSLLEAMAHGVVPVVSDLASGVSEVVDQRSGIVINPADIDGYAAGIVRLAQDRSALAAMSENAAARVRDIYSAAAMTDRWLNLLNQLAKTDKKQKWPASFVVKGPLNSNSLRYFPAVRALRRLARRGSSWRTRA
jgi:glycosyltransferase involved in cell wall biosynthesis